MWLSFLIDLQLNQIVNLLQAAAGHSLKSALLNSIEGFVSGIWFALFVLLWSTIWPIVAIHAGSNVVIILKALSEPGTTLSGQGYALAILLQIPLLIISFWWLSKQGTRDIIPDVT